ncbi:radical SAM family heme chaperone HemW [Muricauda sp. JGD-17]|uniref:Heme chaperone HemW n=1 Tax=Flagellimonas ochracea TaxID=2696472 RepID=A0A964WY99_9FLAO|nr:radical SAM family heme chaperone HemW [Allomuricauda ochracea]NAY92692.1 radical SAM family heme chaperone HemW [Allomuricauda ochracea]
MAGIYVHVPFCKQACHYCDFHFSTQLGRKEKMVDMLQKEMELRKGKFQNDEVETIYFGGGTPSVLKLEEIERLIQAVYNNYKVIDHPEITLEANPDDLANNRIIQLSKSPINRLSIGIQSFFDEDLKLMNRAHNAGEAQSCIQEATKYFENISIDLIYGIPGMDHERWKVNIEKALTFQVPHISSYALTVEPRTALKKFIEKGIVPDVDDAQAHQQFHILEERLEKQGYINYEISNFGKPGFFSKNNTSYWQGKKYMGIGPSAHSFDGQRRAWNVRNNIKYINALEKGELPMEMESLSKTDQYNEYIMTGLRTIWGVTKQVVNDRFGKQYLNYLNEQSQKYVDDHLLFEDDGILLATKKGKFLVDGIAADLFMVNLEK